MKTLPAVEGEAAGHRLGFPYNIRRGLGLWKLLYLSDEPVISLAADAPANLALGRYLVEGPGHCGECHTPRDFAGGVKKGQWLAGAPAAEGKGVVPNITPGEDGIGGWSEGEIAELSRRRLYAGIRFGRRAMAEVVKTTAELDSRGSRGDRRLPEGRAAAPQRLSGPASAGAGPIAQLG